MRFTFDGKIFVIEFQRSYAANYRIYHDDGTETLVQNKYPSTTAKLIEVLSLDEKGKVATSEVVRTYTVSCHYKDHFDREIGRKYSLEMALYDAPIQGVMGSPIKGGEPLMGKRLTKEFRTAVWDAYHGRPGGLFSSKVPAEQQAVGDQVV